MRYEQELEADVRTTDAQGHDTIDVRTGVGTVRGTIEDGLARFRGIRFAGAERFAAPVPEPAWEGVRTAFEEGPACPQPDFGLRFLATPKSGPATDEDCLYLSVTAPRATVEPLPVLVWIHGGGYINGCGGGEVFEPARLARDGNVIVVGLNYRLGVFGFLHVPGVAPANLGLQDMLVGLRWVRDHIRSFGGDPSNITLIGQSAGGHAIAQLLVVDGAEDLFSRAIMLSPPLGLDGGRTGLSRRLADEFLACVEGSPMDCTAEQLLDAQAEAAVRARRVATAIGMPYAPLPGHWPLPPASEYAERMSRRRIDLVIGHTRDEVTPFFDKVAPMRKAQASRMLRPLAQAVSNAMTRIVFRNPMRRFADRIRRAGGRVFTYRFDWRPENTPWGACHCIELPFVFATEEFWEDAPMLGGATWSDLERFGTDLRRSWGAFARTGLPSSSILGDWHPFSRRTGRDTLLDLAPGYAHGPAGDRPPGGPSEPVAADRPVRRMRTARTRSGARRPARVPASSSRARS